MSTADFAARIAVLQALLDHYWASQATEPETSVFCGDSPERAENMLKSSGADDGARAGAETAKSPVKAIQKAINQRENDGPRAGAVSAPNWDQSQNQGRSVFSTTGPEVTP